MAKFNRRWTLQTATNLIPAMAANKVPVEYQEKLRLVEDGLKNGTVKYEEEYHIDTAANTVQWFIFLNGQKIKDFGVNKCDVESDNFFDDGRPIKMKPVIHSDSKISVHNRFEDFSIVSVAEIHDDDKLVVSTEGNGQTTVWTFKPSS